MKPKSLSASSVQCWESCPARWEAEWFHKAPQPSGSAANLGTVCHSALEWYVKSDSYTRHGKPRTRSALQAELVKQYDAVFGGLDDRSRLAEATEMIDRWYARTTFDDRTVLSAEVKRSFQIKTSQGPIPFNYIWDRCDQLLEQGDQQVIEVVDYKTVMRPIAPDALKSKLQARCYGLAAQIQYPTATRIWVTFDLLRHDPVGVVFTREENIATWRYLQRTAEAILATPEGGCSEDLNSECHWCVRKGVCVSLVAHGKVGGSLALSDVNEAVRQRAELENAKRGLTAAVDELDAFILEYADREQIVTWDAGGLTVRVVSSARREIDAARAAKVIGADVVATYGKLNVGAVDALLKSGDLTPEQKADLRGLIEIKSGQPRIVTEVPSPIDI